jgi:tetratricopeptide (TPR) repeat protein
MFNICWLLAIIYAALRSWLDDDNQFEEAEAAYRQAIRLSPNYATAWHWYSLFLTRFPLRIDEAVAMSEKATELDPRSSIIQNWLGSVYFNKGLYSMAEIQYKKLIDLDPDQWQDSLGLYQAHGCFFAWILMNTGDEDLGRSLLQEATVFLEETLPASIEHADIYNPEICFLAAGN